MTTYKASISQSKALKEAKEFCDGLYQLRVDGNCPPLSSSTKLPLNKKLVLESKCSENFKAKGKVRGLRRC